MILKSLVVVIMINASVLVQNNGVLVFLSNFPGRPISHVLHWDHGFQLPPFNIQFQSQSVDLLEFVFNIQMR